MLIDSHAHILYFEESKQLEIIKNAFESGIKIINNISTEVKKFPQLLASCYNLPNIYCTIGTHPCYVQNEPEITTEFLVNTINNNPKIIGIGETGLDFFHDTTHKALQIQQFWQHIFASVETQKPIIIHTRNSDDKILEILHKARLQFGNKLKILIHCFTGNLDFCQKLIDLNCYISFSGIITFKNAIEIQKCVNIVTENRIIIETDSPYLAPEPMRGKENQPAFVKFVAEKVAFLRNTSVKNVEKFTGQNFLELFDVNL